MVYGTHESFSASVINGLNKEGYSREWLCSFLGITIEQLEWKLENNIWRVGEITQLTKLLNLNG